ncbi:DUF2156 domain-containing protein [bacterium]|nr:DUF2156 domain-containing protein [bacterium]
MMKIKTAPVFPAFKPLSIDDREIISGHFLAYPTELSDYTYTNMFIWRHYYRVQWSMLDQWLLILYNPMQWGHYFLQPIGPAGRPDLTIHILKWLRDEKDEPEPRVDRGDRAYIEELAGNPELYIEPVRDQYDYVYSTEELIKLAGRKFHTKKNHLNRFTKTHAFEYETLTANDVSECIHVLKKWCNWRECEKNLIMRAEFEAVHEALIHFSELHITGGLIRIQNQVEAFAMGEMLNKSTAVIHVEKANNKIDGVFAAINQQFAEHAWAHTEFINREQDLGVEGLRQAKKSYNPHHMAEKFRIRLHHASD